MMGHEQKGWWIDLRNHFVITGHGRIPLTVASGASGRAVIIHEHTRVGTGFHCTVLGSAHCPALQTADSIVRAVPSALASKVPELK